MIEVLLARQAQAYVTSDIILEYGQTVEYLLNKYPQKPFVVPLATIVEYMKLIEARTNVNVCRDLDDNKFIGCVIDAECIYIVSGDKDLLEIGNYKDVTIITVAEFLKCIDRQILVFHQKNRNRKYQENRFIYFLVLRSRILADNFLVLLARSHK